MSSVHVLLQISLQIPLGKVAKKVKLSIFPYSRIKWREKFSHRNTKNIVLCQSHVMNDAVVTWDRTVRGRLVHFSVRLYPLQNSAVNKIRAKKKVMEILDKPLSVNKQPMLSNSQVLNKDSSMHTGTDFNWNLEKLWSIFGFFTQKALWLTDGCWDYTGWAACFLP